MTDTPDTAKALTSELRALLEKCPGLPWAYRPEEYDDWGFVRAAPDDEGRRYVVAGFRAGTQLEEWDILTHRKSGTDPYGDTAKLAVAAVNSLPALLSRIEALEEALGEILVTVEGEAYEVTVDQQPCRHTKALNEVHETARSALGEK